MRCIYEKNFIYLESQQQLCWQVVHQQRLQQSTSASADTSAVESKADETTTAASENKTTFTVGFDQDFPPMGFVGDNGEFTGFDLELAAEAAKRMGKEIKYQPISWDAKDMELTSGNIDVSGTASVFRVEKISTHGQSHI